MNSSSGTTDDIVADNPDAWLRSVEERLRGSVGGCVIVGQGPTIFRVPLHLRENDEKAYEPRMVSLGPYHRGKERLKAMEESKWYYLRKQLAGNGGRDLNYYLRKMKELEERARSCYSEKIEMSSDAFAEMLLLDGSFVVQLLIMTWRNEREEEDPTTSTAWFSWGVYYDMVLFENQLPFFVLQTLYDSIFPSGESRYFSSLVHSCFHRFAGIKIPEIDQTSEYYHLLHLIHSCITSTAPTAPGHLQNPEPQTRWHKLWECLCSRRSPCCETTSDVSDSTILTIPNAVRLNEAGIKFKMSERHSLPYVTFQNGVVEMGQLVLFDVSGALLRNLIVFEQCHPESGAYMRAYAVFMEYLVLKTEDVALLQKKGVLLNQLGSEEAAVQLLRTLGKNVVLSFPRRHLEDVFIQVNQYHSLSRWPRWRARLVRDYFSNPWSILSLIAASILLALSVAGTTFTILHYYFRKSKQA